MLNMIRSEFRKVTTVRGYGRFTSPHELAVELEDELPGQRLPRQVDRRHRGRV